MSCCGQSRSEWQSQQSRLNQPSWQTRHSQPSGQTRQTGQAPARAAPGPSPSVQPGPMVNVPPTARRSPAPADRPAPAPTLGTVTLRYLARSPILVQGAVSGRAYRFSEHAPLQPVARADASAMLASGHFRREA